MSESNVAENVDDNTNTHATNSKVTKTIPKACAGLKPDNQLPGDIQLKQSRKMFGVEFVPASGCGWSLVKYMLLMTICIGGAVATLRWAAGGPRKLGPGRPMLHPEAPPGSPRTPLVVVVVCVALLIAIEGGVCNTWAVFE